MKLAFVGCGAAGRPLGIAWRRSGHVITSVVSPRSAIEAAEILGEGEANGSLDSADVVVFATPDDALAQAAAEHALRRDQVALHLSGAHPSTILDPTGARVGSLHPLCAFADPEAAVARLSEVHFFVEGDEAAEALARDLSAHVHRIATDRKALYHAGAVVAANYTVTLVALARELFGMAGVAPADALAALLPLARGALENVAHVGVEAGLTGPCARGDVAVIRAHLEALPEREREIYRALLAATIPLARAKGGLSEDAEAALRDLTL